MGVFDKIQGALTGKPTGAGTLNKVGIDSTPMDDLRAGRAANMARQGLNPDGSPLQSAMAAHADKVHPVGPKK